VVTWLLVKNRLEYPIHREIRNYINSLERDQGLLWRYLPILNELGPDNLNCKEMLTRSRDGRVADMAPEDYGNSVRDLIDMIKGSGSTAVSPETIEELEKNFAEHS